MADEATKIDDGGPAFPLNGENRAWDGVHEWSEREPGMSLRDYLAAKALQGWLAGCEIDNNFTFNVKALAEEAYQIADAMIAARKAVRS